MVTLRKAAEQALAAIKSANQVNYSWACVEAVAALEAALAEPNKCTHGVTDGNCKECYMAESEQEPVAWMDREGDLYKMPEIKNWAPPHKMLYTAPPQSKPLSEEEIGKAWSVADGEHNASAAVKRRITRAIEQAHGIKGEA